jgi:hypothetical protein
MRGVLRSHRGQGISIAMKLPRGRVRPVPRVRWLRTFHHPDNTSAIGMNRRLGFVDEDRMRWRS